MPRNYEGYATGDQIRDGMELRGIKSAAELARLAKVPPSTVQRILKINSRKPHSTETLEKLAASLGCWWDASGTL